MALDLEMKSTVDSIRSSRETRFAALDQVRKDAKSVLRDTQKLMGDFAAEGKARKKDIETLAKGVNEFLKTSSANRKQDFWEVMKGVRASLADVSKDSQHARNEGKRIVKEAESDRATARKYWASLSNKETKAEHKEHKQAEKAAKEAEQASSEE